MLKLLIASLCALSFGAEAQIGAPTTGAPPPPPPEKADPASKRPAAAAKDQTTQAPGTPEGGALGTRSTETVDKAKRDKARRKKKATPDTSSTTAPLQ